MEKDVVNSPLSIFPETFGAEIAEALKPAIEAVAEALKRITDRALEILRELARVFRYNWAEFLDKLLAVANDDPKAWHLYKHAKKARTRKKYKKRLMQKLVSAIKAGALSEEAIT